MSQWQSISTAPNDGSTIIAGYWHEQGWFSDLYDADPDAFAAQTHGFSRDVAPLTHWMQLPEPPANPAEIM